MLRKSGVMFAICVATLASWSDKIAVAEHAGVSMVTGSITSQPIGHYNFCKQFPDECNQRHTRSKPPKLTNYGWDIVRQVNKNVNDNVLPLTDWEIHGEEEVWSYPGTVGDCEDYVLLKRQMLIDHGFSPSDLLITVVRKSDGEGHAILTLRTDQGDYVLDNLADEVKIWTETPYQYIKRQAAFHTGRWVNIENSNTILLSSIR